MTRDELLKNHETICQEARDLMELKNLVFKYGNEN